MRATKKSSTDREHCIVVLDRVAVTKLSTISDQKAGPDNMGCFWNKKILKLWVPLGTTL